MRGGSKTILVAVIILLITALAAHSIGITLAYFVPRNGYFSNPVSPLSLRDIGVTFGDYLGLAGSLTFYHLGGLGLKDGNNKIIKLEDGPAVGPLNSLLGSLVGKLILPLGDFELTGQGGLFGFFNLNPRLMTGNLDRYIASQEGETAVQSDFDFDGKFGWGYVFGGSVTYYIYGQIGLSVGALYYLGGAKMNFSGTYDTTSAKDKPLPSYLEDARLDYSGLEILLGVSYRL